MNIPIVYEDDWLLIVDKPSGLLTIPTPKKEQRTLTSILNEDLETKGISCRLHPCHRLDRETSGLLIYAKGKSIQQKMMQEFHKRSVEKKYIAFVQGAFPRDRGELNYPIEGAPAVTRYKVVQKRKDFSIVEAIPLTGRTNQIRIHFKCIGHPIVGESRFAFRRDFKLRFRRLCLHAAFLGFIHPVTKKHLQLTSNLPKDLEEFLKNN